MGFFDKFKRKKSTKDIVYEKLSKTNKEIEQIKYDKGLKKSRESFTKKLKLLTRRHLKLDEKYFEDLKSFLIEADLGFNFVSNLLEILKKEARIKKITKPEQMIEVIFEVLFANYLQKSKNENNQLNLSGPIPSVILVIGVNGVGKTTSIAKLANKLIHDEGKRVLLVAGDTFRAGAVEQLKEWANRIKTKIVLPKKHGQDPASVVYEALILAKKEKYDVVLIDTAGRLQNKVNLMNELNKINKIIFKLTGKEINEKLLVLDATTGQNGILQAKAFDELLVLTGIILTKMDSSSKGGIILPIKQAFSIPVKYIGLGESLDDLEQFSLEKYLKGLLVDYGKVI